MEQKFTHKADDERLLETAEAFNQVATLRDRAEALRLDTKNRMEDYNPLDATRIPGGIVW